MIREYPWGATAAQRAEIDTRRAAAAAAAAAAARPRLAGHASAYRKGGCCDHVRIRHRDKPPMTCTEMVITRTVHGDGSVTVKAARCKCEGWKERTP